MSHTVDLIKEIESLIKKAEKSVDSSDALRFSQAACNVANALERIKHIKESWWNHQFIETIVLKYALDAEDIGKLAQAAYNLQYVLHMRKMNGHYNWKSN